MAKQLVFILGAGGHAKMVIEALVSMHQYELYGCLDTDRTAERLLGFPVMQENPQILGTLLEAKAQAVVALGENRLRMRVTNDLEAQGFSFATAIASSAYVSASAQIGAGSVIMPKAVVGAAVRVGRGVIVNTSSSIDHDCVVEDFAHVAPGCHLAGNVTVQQGAMLGIGTCVIPECTIGKWSILGANSTVIEDVPLESTYVGTPAKALKAGKERKGL
jgi:sugar O-acyltransferase (sialic acid O-acetyltransferase NeuD family)